ncbi:hypothetical protein L0F63_001911 [Massospora cicadina]|nr:hypothetical protein L0F63_001911 [Massospora cicadina]
MNSYQRRVVHRVADYFNLSHSLDSDKKAIVLRKNERTEIPVLRMSDLIEVEEENPKVSLKIMQRTSSAEASRHFKGLEEREAKYQQARARIFNGNSSSSSTETKATGPPKEKGGPAKTEVVKPKATELKEVRTPERAPSSTGSTRRSDNLSSSRTSPILASKPLHAPFLDEQPSFVNSYKSGHLYPTPFGSEPTGPTFDALPFGVPPSSDSQFTPTTPYYDPYAGQFFLPAQPAPYFPTQFYPYPPYNPSPDQPDPRLGKTPGPIAFNISEADAPVAPSLYYSLNPPPYTCSNQPTALPNPFPYDSSYRFWGAPESSPPRGFRLPNWGYQPPYQPPFHYRPPEIIRRPPTKNRELFDPNKPSLTNDPRRPSPSVRRVEMGLADQLSRSLNLSKPPGPRTPKKQDNLLYDYSGDSYEGVRPTDKPIQPNHILEIYALASEDTLADLVIPGASIRRLKSSSRGPSVLAVFKNSGLASKYLAKFTAEQAKGKGRPRFKLRVWVPTLYDPTKSNALAVSPTVSVPPTPESFVPTVL